jgi:hypothetical protein
MDNKNIKCFNIRMDEFQRDTTFKRLKTILHNLVFIFKVGEDEMHEYYQCRPDERSKGGHVKCVNGKYVWEADEE